MFLFLYGGAKRRSGEISKFRFLVPAHSGVATFSLQNVPESASDSGDFPFLFCCLGLVKSSHTKKRTTKKSEFTLKLYGKQVISFLYPTLAVDLEMQINSLANCY